MEKATSTNALINQFFQEFGDVFNEPTITEEEKNGFALLLTKGVMKELQPADNSPICQEWNDAQSKILEQLKHHVPGAEKFLYSMSEDHQAGAYLRADLDLYRVNIDIEDVRTMEEYQKRGLVKVVVHHQPTNEDPERGNIFNSGWVETMEEAGAIVENLRQGQFDNAMRILFRKTVTGPSFGLRTEQNLEAVVKKSAEQYTVSRWEP